MCWLQSLKLQGFTSFLIGALWPYTLHPGIRRIIKRMPKELDKVHSKDLWGGLTNMPKVPGLKGLCLSSVEIFIYCVSDVYAKV